MQRVLIAAVAITLAGCGVRPDDSICTPIFDPPSAQSADDSLEFSESPDWQRKRADACVHRQAYRLALSEDPAETVAKAVVEFCASPIAGSAVLNANKEVDQGYIDASERDARMEAIVKAYEPFALSKVVEGRAGKCRV